MSGRSSLARRIVAIAAVFALALAAQAVSFSPAGSSPYLSALSSLAGVSEAAAASTCTDRVCDATGTRCVHLHGSHTDCARGDFCRERACV